MSVQGPLGAYELAEISSQQENQKASHEPDLIHAVLVQGPASESSAEVHPTEVVSASIPQPPSGSEDGESEPKRGLIRSILRKFAWLISSVFCLVSLIVILAVLTAIPILQLISYGYLLDVSGKLANGSKLRNSLPHFRQMGRIGLAAVAIFLAALPTQALTHLESVANLVNPGSERAVQMRFLAVSTAMLMTLSSLGVDSWRPSCPLLLATAHPFAKGGLALCLHTAPDRLGSSQLSGNSRYFWLGCAGRWGH